MLDISQIFAVWRSYNDNIPTINPNAQAIEFLHRNVFSFSRCEHRESDSTLIGDIDQSIYAAVRVRALIDISIILVSKHFHIEKTRESSIPRRIGGLPSRRSCGSYITDVCNVCWRCDVKRRSVSSGQSVPLPCSTLPYPFGELSSHPHVSRSGRKGMWRRD